MQLKITSPEKVVFEGEIKKLNIPTEKGYIGILPGHVPLTTVVKPGLVKITVSAEKKEHLVKSSDFLFDENEDIVLSVSKGLLFLDGKTILVVTNAATTSPADSEEILLKNKEFLEQQLEDVRARGSLEEIETAMMDLEKIHADLKLYHVRGILK